MNTKEDRRRIIVEAIQWLLIILIMISLSGIQRRILIAEQYRNDYRYDRIYQTRTIENLKRENQILKDSICVMTASTTLES